MKKTLLIVFTLLFPLIAIADKIERVEPAFWWTGMKNTELQIMVYGENIAAYTPQFNYQGVAIKEVVRVESPNYLFIYLDIKPDTPSGIIHFNFTKGKQKIGYQFELKPRASSVGAQGFDSSDVLYLIMPDRFANGDERNDVWDGVPIERDKPFGRHGGDLQGIIDHMDYLTALGITAIWLNPVLENKMPQGSYHGYATTDFYKVDPRFGTNDDYCRFINEAHKKGLKVVMDMIFNHCGSEHWWMKDFPTSDWLNFQDGFVPTNHAKYSLMDTYAPESEKRLMLDGWFVSTMPDLNQRNRLMADYLIQNSIWWIEYSRIDGIRHDTHPYADYDFLARWCKAVEDEYPDFNIVGESWYLTQAPLAWWQRNSALSGRQQSNLKTVMDFYLMNTISETFVPGVEKHNPMEKVYEVIAQDFLYEDPVNLLTFLDNHDLSRFFKKEETDLGRFKQLMALLLTTRGIPQLYYGTEILMTGEKHEGDGLLRKDFPGGWEDDPVNAFTPEGRTALQNEAWDYLQILLQWRKGNKVISEGKLIHYAPDWQSETYVYARIKDNKTVLVMMNGTNKEKMLNMERYYEVIKDNSIGKDIITGKQIPLKGKLSIPPKGVYIMELE